jgi:hypothetical protein
MAAGLRGIEAGDGCLLYEALIYLIVAPNLRPELRHEFRQRYPENG